MSYRNITVDNVKYGFVIGRQIVKVKGPNGSKVVYIHTLLGCTPDDLERVLWKNYDCVPTEYAITPKKIADYIRREFK